MSSRRRVRRRKQACAARTSKLETSEERFLALALDAVLTGGFRDAESFLNHFPPIIIGRSLVAAPSLHRSILAIVAGLTEDRAARQGPQQTGALLERAFEDGDATPELLLQLLTPDDCVRYLDARRLWRFVSDHKAWVLRPGDAMLLRRTVTALLEAAVEADLIRHCDVVRRIPAARLAMWLPPEQLAGLLEVALSCGDENRLVEDEDIARSVSLSALSRAAPPLMLVEKVIVPLLEPRMLARLPKATAIAPERQATPPPPPPANRVRRRRPVSSPVWSLPPELR